MYRRKRIIGSGAVAMLATILAPFGSSTASSASTTSTIAEPSPGFTSTQADLTQGCTPAVMVVRHAEDEANPVGGADILSAVGKKHAALYPDLFRKYLAEPHSIGPDRAEVTVCPIGKIIAIDPKGNTVNPSPSSNPYDTIKPLADYLNLRDPGYGSRWGALFDGVQLGHARTSEDAAGERVVDSDLDRNRMGQAGSESQRRRPEHQVHQQ